MLISVIMLINLSFQSSWCYTDSYDVSSKFDASLGGSNWGYCADAAGGLSLTSYSITLKPAPGYVLAGKFNLKLIGDSATESFVLNESSAVDKEETFEVKNVNIGDVWAIESKVTGNDGNKFLFSMITIQKGVFKYIFRASQSMEEEKVYVDPISGSSPYLLTFKKEVNKFCTGVLKIKFFGTMNNSSFVILTTKGLNPSLRDIEFKVSTNEVGEIGEVHIGRIVEEGDVSQCDLQGIVVEHPVGKIAFDYKISNEPFISTKVMKQSIEKALDPMAMLNKNGANAEALLNGDEGSEEALLNSLTKDSSGSGSAPLLASSSTVVSLEELEFKKKAKLKEYLELNISPLFNLHYDGSQCLSKDKGDSVKTFSCDDKIDPNQHFDIQQNNTIKVFQGVKSMIIKCGECYTDSIDDVRNVAVSGITLHPMTQSPCRAAYVDRVLPRTGGLVELNIAPGMESELEVRPRYSVTDSFRVRNILVNPVSSSILNYYLTPVDNIDNMSNKIRILNMKNQPDSMGRVEVLLNEDWNSLCVTSDPKIARFVCASLGFKYGFRVYDDNVLQLFRSGYRSLNTRKNLVCENNAQDLDGCFIYGGEDNKCGASDKDLVVRCSDFLPHSSIKDKTELKAEENGTTEIVPKYIKETTNDGEVNKTEMFYCFPPKLDNDIIKALNVMCHFKKFENYVSILSEPLESSQCWSIRGCQDCGFDNVDNIQKFQENVDQNTLKLIIKCEGKIDQNKAEPIKGYNRLSMPPIKILDCEDSLNKLMKSDSYAYGQPGSSFLVYCPQECQSQSDKKVFGNSYFSETTSICFAALFRELDSPLVQVTVGYPMYDFRDNLQTNNVTSLAFKPQMNTSLLAFGGGGSPYSISFTVSEYSQCLLGMANDDLIESKAPPVASNPFGSLFGFIQKRMKSSAKVHKDYKVVNSRFKHKLVSFVQIDSNVLTKGQEWYYTYYFDKIPLGYYYSEKFDSAIKIKTGLYPNFSSDKWTILFGYRMMNKPENNTQVSMFRVDGDDGFALVVKTVDDLSVVNLQTYSNGAVNNTYKLSAYVSESQARLDYYTLTYNNGSLVFYKNMKKAVTENSIFLGNINQLNQTENSTEFVVDSENSGWVKYIYFFNQVLDDLAIKGLASKEIFKPPIGKPIKMTTKDERVCRSECSTKPTPGNAGSPQPPVEAVVNSSESKDRIQIAESVGKKDNEVSYQVGSDYLQCSMDLDMMSTKKDEFPDFVEHKSYRFTCPTTCDYETLQLKSINNDYGFNIYAPDNSICRAAKNDGILKEGKVSDVYVTLTKFPKNNIIISSSLGFRLSLAPELPTLTSYDRLSQKDVLFGGPDGTKYSVLCPKGVLQTYLHWSEESKPVYGNFENGYSETSSVCIAALHAGIMSDAESKEVKFEIISKTSSINFKCEPYCDDNGVKSSNDKWQRGFKFLEHNLKCRNTQYVVNENNLLVDFDQSSDNGAGAGAWGIVNSLAFNRNVIANQNKKAGTPMHTKMVFQKSECVNGKFKVNIWFNEDLLLKSFVAVIFRYIKIGNDEHYYFVKLNHSSVSLNVFKGGSIETIREAPGTFVKNVVYRVSVSYELNHIQVYVQSGKERQRVKYIDVFNDYIKRGRVGFGVNDSETSQFDGLEVGPPLYEVEKDLKDYDECVKLRSLKERQKMCSPNDCTYLYQYCTYCCAKMFVNLEQTDLYNCKKECLTTNQ